MDARAARLAVNEAVFRAGNEAIAANARAAESHRGAAAQAGAEGESARREYLCECGNETCFEAVRMTETEYERVRADPGRFFVLPGHEDLTAGEAVAARCEGYLVVEKHGVARAAADRGSPRR